MTIATDIPSGSPRTVNVSVDAVPAGVTPTPAAVDFGVEAVNTTTLGQSVILSNCDTTTVAFSNAHIEGTDAGDFAIVSAPPNPMIMGIGNVTWLVVITTHSRGTKHAEFVVDYGGGTVRVALDGEGLGEPGGGSGSGSGSDETPIGESSYYACSTGAAEGLLPIGFVVRRRRRARR